MNTLACLFAWLLAASLRASLLTAATLLFQAALRQHLSARMRHALWLPVLVVLLMPVLPQSRWSIEQMFQAPSKPVQITPAFTVATDESPPVVFTAPVPLPEPIDWQSIFIVVWGVISAAIFIFGGASYLLTMRRFKQDCQPASAELLTTLSQIGDEVGLRRVPQVLTASSISSPAVTGLLHSTLLLPAQFDQEFTPAEARLVLKHELMHLKRGDLPLNALMCVLMALHWFNPLLWIAFFKVRADREAACDAQVLHDAPSARRVEYGHALLKVETAFCPRGLSLGFVGIFQRGSVLRSRIQYIAVPHKPRPVMKAISATCIILMTFFGITRAQRPEPEKGFTLGQASFRSGDSIRIHSVQTTAESITVAADYELSSEEEASISLFVTTHSSDPVPVDPRQRALIKKGRGSVVLVHPNPQKGLPHVSFYTSEGKPFGGIYFGTEAEAAQSKALNLDYMTASAPAPSGGAAQFIQNKLEKIILPVVRLQGASVEEAIEVLRVKGRDHDTTTMDPKQRGVNILLKSGVAPTTASISLDLKDVPLGEALRYVVELANLKMSIQPFAVLVTESFPVTSAASPLPQAAAGPPSGKVVIPSIEFRDASLSECIDFIRIKSREFDPDQKGANIVLKTGDEASTHITLSLKDVPVSEALRYCAELGRHKLTSDARSFFLTPATEAAPTNKDQASNPAEAKAAELRKGRAQQYNFNKAALGDVLRFLATDAAINFVSLPDDNPINQRLMTFSIRSSPFEVLETLCKANGLALVLDHERWFIRPSDDSEQIGKTYVLPKTQVSVETILNDVSAAIGSEDTRRAADTPKPSVTFQREQNAIYVKASRLQHTWVSAYFRGLSSSAQSSSAR